MFFKKRRIKTIHPKVPNPYSQMSLLHPEKHRYIHAVVNLKDAFFNIPLQRWVNPSLFLDGQIQREDIMNNLLRLADLRDLRTPQFCLMRCGVLISCPYSRASWECTLQYVDDHLLASETEGDCRWATEGLLQELKALNYRNQAGRPSFVLQKLSI